MGSGWGAGAKTLRIATLSLVYSTAEYFAPVWCRSDHTRLIDGVLNDALRIVTGCLRPTPTDHLPVLSGIQPAELRRLGATLSLAYRGSLDPDHILHGLLSGSSDTGQVRLRSRRPFVPGARNLLDNLPHTSLAILNPKDSPYSKTISLNQHFLPKILFLSRIILPTPKQIKSLTTLLFKFLWNFSPFEPIKRSTLYLPKPDGGIALPNIGIKTSTAFLWKFIYLLKIPNPHSFFWICYLQYWY